MRLDRCLLILGGLLSLISAVVVATTVNWSAGVSGFIVLLMILPIVPLGLTTLVGWLFRKSRPALITSMIALIVAFGFMAFLFINAFFIHLDAQGGLILVFGPIYTLVGLIPFGIVALVLFLRKPRSASL